ncbi:dioxygenase [Raphidocelis subcapitata]|uniref:Dioxygenase n=1 Tax=Raphidocelis subcapitata TaxID=307507 RepID=A0A2V0NZ30_9CHLO|nr:dioxygenase [Raphidocelis subcapitata]|eukprot:GBF92894.1 dioxygenase [Raphidocelis subcapitata]
MRLPTLFVSHGGGPLPLLGDAAHAPLAASLRALPARLGLPAPPRAILLCSAHYEQPGPSILPSPPPDGGLLFDYYGFPPESYAFRYAPRGAPDVAESAAELLTRAGFTPRLDTSGRGLDHGAFVPLMLMWPQGEVPVVELSVLSSLSAEEHLRMGEALAPLRDEGVLLVGSGSSFHSIPKIFEGMRGGGGGGGGGDGGELIGQAFDDYLAEACTCNAGAQRAQKLAAWASAPGAREAHPRAEHLMPLLFATGAAGGDAGRAERVALGRVAMSSFVFGGQAPPSRQ